jgi:hypothetical protein
VEERRDLYLEKDASMTAIFREGAGHIKQDAQKAWGQAEKSTSILEGKEKAYFHDLFDEAKRRERQSLHNALQNASATFLKRHRLQDISDILLESPFASLKGAFNEKIKRLFILLFIHEKKLNLEEAIKEANKLKLEKIDWFSQNPTQKLLEIAHGAGLSPSKAPSSFFAKYSSEIEKEIKLLQNENLYHAEIAALKECFAKLKREFNCDFEHGRMQDPSGDAYRKSTNKILKELRTALRSPLYTLSRTQENNLFTHYLHNLSCAGYHDNVVNENFESFGKKILAKTAIDSNLSVIEKIERTWEKLGKVVPSSTAGSLNNFSIEEKTKLAGEYIDYAISGVVQEDILKRLDERKFPDNIPSSVAQENCTLHLGEQEYSVGIRLAYTCNPTIGFEIAPEFSAILQAMENRYFTQIENDPYPYRFWSYVNLQYLANRFEHPHAIALMRLNDAFPLSFRGISVTQNSPFYVTDPDSFDDKYKDQFLQQLLDKDNFTLEDRLETRQGGAYYFPKSQQKRWESALPTIVNNVYEKIKANREPNHTVSDLSKAFKELVNLSIIRYHQQLSLETLFPLAKMNSLKNTVNMIHSMVCKSCIDRGGKNTFNYLYALSDADILALGAVHGRTLLVGRRLMLDKYAPSLFALKNIPRTLVHDLAKTSEDITEHSKLIFRSIEVLR